MAEKSTPKKPAKAAGMTAPAKAADVPAKTTARTAKKPTLSVAEQTVQLHLHLFHEGNDAAAYHILGAHPETWDGQDGYVFRVWAPDARSISVVGDFCEWKRENIPMRKISVGIWEAFVPGLSEFSNYKYSVETVQGHLKEKADPYAFHAETRPFTASKTFDLAGYAWHDEDWRNREYSPYDTPMNIYELNLGSWQRGDDGNRLSYIDIAERLAPYIKDMGYTHIELMPIMEHPFDGSWGYQVTGYFAATSRYGTPHDFMRFVDIFHQAGIGVILDWVPAHFPKDDFALIEFDGTCCYEYSDPMRREHPDWGTRVFDYGRNETRSFLMSSAFFWLDKFHVDGLRVDAVASMLYLDYGKKHGEWTPNVYGGKENIEAISLLRRINEEVFKAYPKALMIAEESTAWPMVTKPTYMGGLGFNFKWNMGWMNDTLRYVQNDPVFRQYHHNDITFSLAYAFSENYILPISHDEVVHGKGSLIGRMPGYYQDRFAGVRSYYGYMMSHPGKKLSFMGSEFGQFSEWNYQQSLDWHLLEYESHQKLQHFVRSMNHVYRENSAFFAGDCDDRCFDWLNGGDYQNNTLAFRRMVPETWEDVICLFNFSPVVRTDFRIGVQNPGVYREILNSDDVQFGGWGHTNPGDLHTEEIMWNDRVHSLALTLPPLSAVFLRRVM